MTWIPDLLEKIDICEARCRSHPEGPEDTWKLLEEIELELRYRLCLEDPTTVDPNEPVQLYKLAQLASLNLRHGYSVAVPVWDGRWRIFSPRGVLLDTRPSLEGAVNRAWELIHARHPKQGDQIAEDQHALPAR